MALFAGGRAKLIDSLHSCKHQQKASQKSGQLAADCSLFVENRGYHDGVMSWKDKIFSFRETDEASMKPFLDHLEDLRWTAVKMAVVLVLSMGLALCYRNTLVNIIQDPLATVNPELISTLRARGPMDAISISFSLAFYAGIVLAFPFLLYFVAQFVLPALTLAEKKHILPVVFVGLMLFLGGVLSCYYWLLPITLAFALKDQQNLSWVSNWDVQSYFSFATQFVLSFGLAFELPLVVLFLVRLGVLNYAMLQKTRMVAFVIIFLLSAVITPTTDPFTLCAMALPMYVLYEICIFLAKYTEKKVAAPVEELPLE
ncbi:MAG TPA: twin-arginine translocase subunit TatC [Chthoniobacterales bacterium]|jgi:sec-independent protein translocase protein TatC